MKKVVCILIVFAVFLNSALILSADGTDTDQPAVRDCDFSTPREGNVIFGLEGGFVTVGEEEKAAILARVNEIRKEACDEYVPYPNDRSRTLTPDDYVPLKWSYLVEMVAALRAAEASVYLGHKKLSKDNSIWKNNYGISTHSESLAWNWHSADVDGIIYGINQWYGEKTIWVENTEGVTGHYTSLIDPKYKYIGISAFNNVDDLAKYRLTVVSHMSVTNGLNENTANLPGSVIQKLEVDPDYINSVTLEGADEMNVSETVKLTPAGTLSATVTRGTSGGHGIIYSGLSWQSSDENVASVDEDGNVTALSAGTAVITASLHNGVSGSLNITVLSADDTTSGQETDPETTDGSEPDSETTTDGGGEPDPQTTEYETEAPDPVLIGDVNEDGVTNNKDIVTLFRYLSGFDITVNEEAADVNEDGALNNKDIAALFKMLS